MPEPTSSTAAGASALLHAYGAKAIAGAIAVGIGFALMWPKTRREGVARIICTIAGSALGGRPLLAAVQHWLPWYPADGEMLVFVAAGLPAWWVMGACVLWLQRRKHKDAGELIDELRGKGPQP